ncbi:MAG TPA: hypothetical protein VK658_09175 [Chryseolinea sp.]|nr:hypothetical protein [Chryseolinea sp.]
MHSSACLATFASLLIISALAVTSSSCKKKDNFLKDDRRYFQEMLRVDMDYSDLVNAFGEPPVDLNAEWAGADGLHIYQYPLMDSTFVRIGYTSKIEYACLVDDRSNLVEDMLFIDRSREP